MRPCIKAPIELRDPSRAERDVVVNFTHESIPKWLLDLALVQYELTEWICVSDEVTHFRLQISLVSPQAERSVVEWNADGARLLITRQELEFWLHFFLQYYRDDIGPVDHIDTELQAEHPGASPDLFLVLKVPLARASATGDEGRRALGLPTATTKRKRDVSRR